MNNSNKTTIVIDSRYRDLNPQNVINKQIKLSQDPLFFIKNSNSIYIYQKNHGYNQNDKIIISGVEGKNVYLSNSLYFIYRDTYVTVNHPNHGIQDYEPDETNGLVLKAEISGFVGNNETKSAYNNIPINSINRYHVIYTKKPDTIYNENVYYIKLNTTSNNTFTYNGKILIKFLHINGIPINEINSDYPINQDQKNGFKVINSVINKDIYEIDNKHASMENSVLNLYNYLTGDYNSILNNGLGGSNIKTGLITNFIDGFPYSNNYIITLKRAFYRVNKIKVLSVNITRTEKMIVNNPPNKQNNMLYWQILNDGDYIYNASVTPGNYSLTDLAIALKTSIDLVQRINKTTYMTISSQYEISTNNKSNIVIDEKTQIFSMSLYNEIIVDNAIQAQNLTGDRYTSLLVYHPNHNLNVGDTVIFSNISSFNAIPSPALNTSFAISSLKDGSNYYVTLPRYNNTGSLTNTTSGTSNSIQYPINFRLLFDRPGTMGILLGFKNVGNKNSITDYSTLITNMSGYYNDTNLNQLGLIETNNYSTIFDTYHPYIIVTSSLYKNSITNHAVNDAFMIITLASSSNINNICTKFTQLMTELPIIKQQLLQLDLAFYDPNGKPYILNNYNHSLVIEIYEDKLDYSDMIKTDKNNLSIKNNNIKMIN